MLAIFVAGVGLLVGGIIWLSSGSPDGPAAPVVSPAVAAPAAAASGMAGMAGMAGSSSAASGAKATSAPHVPFDAALPPVGAGTQHHYTIRLKDEVLDIAPGVRYQGWTFEGTSPGPVIHVRQGDWVDVTLVNGGTIPHSIDFHAALTAPDVSFASVPSRRQPALPLPSRDARAPSCTTAAPRPVLAHIANGMYGAIVVDPKQGLPPVAKSFVLVSGEWYLEGDGKAQPATLNFEKARTMQPDYVTFNGYANQYKDNPLTADPGDTVRFYVVDAGPSLDTDFHVVGAILDRVYLDGTTTDVLHGVQTQLVPAGGGMVFDVKFRDRGHLPVRAATPSPPSTWEKSASSTSATSPAP